MTVDVISLIVFALLVILGWRTGALRQILRLLAVVAVICGVPFVSPMIRQIIFDESGRGSPGVEVLSILGAGILIYVTVAGAGWVASRIMRAVSIAFGLMDQAVGAAIGAVKGGVVIYLVVVLVVMMEGPIAESDPDNRAGLRGGSLTSFVAEHNVLAPWQFPDLDVLHDALQVGLVVEELNGHDQVRENADAADALRDDRVRQLIMDEELMRWVGEEHFPMTLADSRVRELLNDAEFMEKLSRIDWNKLRQTLEPGHE